MALKQENFNKKEPLRVKSKIILYKYFNQKAKLK